MRCMPFHTHARTHTHTRAHTHTHTHTRTQALTTSVAVWYGLETFRLRAKEEALEQGPPDLLPPPSGSMGMGPPQQQPSMMSGFMGGFMGGAQQQVQPMGQGNPYMQQPQGGAFLPPAQDLPAYPWMAPQQNQQPEYMGLQQQQQQLPVGAPYMQTPEPAYLQPNQPPLGGGYPGRWGAPDPTLTPSTASAPGGTPVTELYGGGPGAYDAAYGGAPQGYAYPDARYEPLAPASPSSSPYASPTVYPTVYDPSAPSTPQPSEPPAYAAGAQYQQQQPVALYGGYGSEYGANGYPAAPPGEFQAAAGTYGVPPPAVGAGEAQQPAATATASPRGTKSSRVVVERIDDWE